MATLDIAFKFFEETFKRVIEHFNMKGTCQLMTIPHIYKTVIIYKFKFSYLTISDEIYYDCEDRQKYIMDETLKHLADINFQLKYYFNELWC